MTRDPDKDFLSRWSARKREAREDRHAPEPPEPVADDTPAPPFTQEELETLSDAELCARLSLPDPGTLQQGDDFKVFLEAHVPERLKRVALRRLWRSNPVLACLDGLNDYDEDYTGASAAPGALKTLYRVGKGFAAREPEAETPEQGQAGPSGGEDAVAQNIAAMQTSYAEQADSAAESGCEDAPESHDETEQNRPAAPDEACVRPPRPRTGRMSFRFVKKTNMDQ